MSGLIMPQVVYGLSNEELAELVAKALKEIDWAFNGNISDQNISRIANFIASKTELKHISGIVGMSGFDPANPLAVRFWAGNADKDLALFRVLQNGKFFATDGELTGKIEALSGHIGGFTIEADKLSSDSSTGIIQGGTVRTGAPGSARVEMKDNSVQTFNNDDHLQGPVWGETNPSANYGDFSLYDGGVEVIRFENQLAGNGYLIKSVGGISSLRLGGVGRNTQATGTWRFYGNTTFDQDINGKISEAYFADHAATASAADELSPSGEIAWGQVLKGGSNIADLATKNLSSLTEDSTHRTVTDAEKAKWNTVDSKPTMRVVFGSGTTGLEQTFSGLYYSTLTINYTGFTSPPHISPTNLDTLAAWISAVTPITNTSATIYLTSTVAGIVANKNIKWSASGT